MKKKKLCILLSIAMLLIIVACANDAPGTTQEDTPATAQEDPPAATQEDPPPETNGTDTDTITDITFPLAEPVTMSMVSIINGNTEVGDTLAFQRYTEMTNVHWEIQSFFAADIFERVDLMLAAGDYPDVFYRAALNDAQVFRHATHGTFIPLTDLLAEFAPNFTAELDSRPGAREMITQADGHIYTLPQLSRAGSGWFNLFINQAWLTTLELDMPTNLDEFYETLVAFRTQDPNGNGEADEIPFTMVDGWLRFFIPYFGVQYDPNSTISMVYIDGEYQHWFSSERYKEFLAYMARLYDEGLLDRNAFIQDNAQQHALGASGDVIGVFFDIAAFLTVGRERDPDFVRIPTFDDNVLPFALGVGGGAFAITDRCEHPEIAIAWVDYFYSEEGGTMVFMGFEGETFSVNENGTWDWILGDFADIGALREASAMQGGALDPSRQPDLWFRNDSDPAEYKFNNIDRAADREINFTPFPIPRFTEEEETILATVRADLDPYIDQFKAQVVTGLIDLESNWEDYINTMNRMGLQDIIDIVLEARQR